MRLQAQGMTLDQWLESSGQDSQDFVDSLRDTAARAAKFDLALRAVVAAEQIEVDDDDLEAEYVKIADQLQLEPKAVRKQFEDADQVSALLGDVRRSKAMAFIVETVEIVDEDGNVIDRADLEPPPDDDDTVAEAPADVAGSVEDSTDEATAVAAGTETEAETETEEGTE